MEQDLEKVTDLFQQGLGRTDIANRLGVPKRWVDSRLAMLRREGRIEQALTLTLAQKAEILSRYATGEGVSSIAQSFGCAEASVRHFAYSVGVKRPEREPLEEVRAKENERNGLRTWAVNSAAKGWTVSNIARIVGVSRERVRQWVEEDGGTSVKSCRTRHEMAVGPLCPHCGGGLTALDLAKTIPVSHDDQG